MQRIEPRPVDAATQSQQQGYASSSSAPGKQSNIPTGLASTGSQSHTQSFEEIYGVPENFLEIEVRSAAPLYEVFKTDLRERRAATG